MRDNTNAPSRPASRFIASTALLTAVAALGLPLTLAAAQPPAQAQSTTASDASKPALEPLDNSHLDAAIRENRMGTLRIIAPPGAEVHVQQFRHDFWFGATLPGSIFSDRASPDAAARYKRVFLENFNAAVIESAFKWHAMEPKARGQVDYSIVDAMLDWADQNEIPVRGHCVFWGIENFLPAWQKKPISDEELREAVRARALDIARRYRGRFAEYDLNNEMLHGNYYEERLGPNITKDMANWMKEGDPNAVLFTNDYDILTGHLVEEYITHIKRFLDQGVPFAGIGVQGHLHGDSFDPAALQNALDRLATLKLPIRVTEFNFPGQRSKYYGKRGARLSDEEEQAKAKALTEYFRVCFAHPAVEGILLWGFWEGASWIPVSALYRLDGSPTPAALAYRDLVFRQWWTDYRGRADASGRCDVPVFYGKHRVTAGDNSTVVNLRRVDRSQTVSLTD